MRYLTDTEILNWNDRLNSSNYMLRPQHSSRISYCDIIFVQKVQQRGNLGIDFVDTTDPSIQFKFVFSIASNRQDDFWRIFDKRKVVSIATKTNYKDKLGDLFFSDSIVSSKETENHNVKEKEFTRYIYNFSGKLSQIISYVAVLEDCIRFLEMMFGYDETGKEYCLTPYPLGTVCSMVDDKSSDWLVLDYDFKITQGYYEIEYKIAKMLWNDKSPVLKYGDVISAKEKELCFSRNNRIDNILEQ